MAFAGCYWWIGKDNERLENFNHQLKPNCQSQRASLAAYKKILICYTWRADTVKAQVQHSIKWVIELQKLLNSHTQQVCKPKSGPWIGRSEILKFRMRISGLIDPLANFVPLHSTETSQLAEVAQPFLLKVVLIAWGWSRNLCLARQQARPSGFTSTSPSGYQANS